MRPAGSCWRFVLVGAAQALPTAHSLKEWCVGIGCSTAYIPTGSPWDNPFVESFNSRFRDEFLNIERHTSLQDATLLAEQHRIKYAPGSHPAMESGLTSNQLSTELDQ